MNHRHTYPAHACVSLVVCAALFCEARADETTTAAYLAALQASSRAPSDGKCFRVVAEHRHLDRSVELHNRGWAGMSYGVWVQQSPDKLMWRYYTWYDDAEVERLERIGARLGPRGYAARRSAQGEVWKGTDDLPSAVPRVFPCWILGLMPDGRMLCDVVLGSRIESVRVDMQAGKRLVTVTVLPSSTLRWTISFSEARQWFPIQFTIDKHGRRFMEVVASDFQLGLGRCLIPTRVELRQDNAESGVLSDVHSWRIDPSRSGHTEAAPATLRHIAVNTPKSGPGAFVLRQVSLPMVALFDVCPEVLERAHALAASHARPPSHDPDHSGPLVVVLLCAVLLFSVIAGRLWRVTR